MAIDPANAVFLASSLRGVYEQAELDAMAATRRRLERGIAASGWAEAKAAELGALRRELESVVADLDRLGPEAYTQLVTSAHVAGANAARQVLGSEVVARVNLPAVEAFAREAGAGLASTHLAILRQSTDVYREVLAQNAGSVLAGAATRRQVTQRILDQWAARGITGFVDSAGRHWDLASYAEMSTRTATMRAYNEGHMGYLAQNGRDLVIVSDSPDECPWCRPWEGRVLSISGSAGYPSVAEARDTGLFHASCTHQVSAYVPGLSRPRATADPEGRAERDRQRALERRIRVNRRREALAVGPEQRALAARRLSAAQADMRSFITTTGRRRDFGREAIRLGRPQVTAAARDIYQIARVAEPAITSTLRGIARATSGHLRGLQFRLKTEQSIARKLSTDLAQNPSWSLERGVVNIRDEVRYTFEYAEADYAVQVQSAIARLEADGYTFAGGKNFFVSRADGYAAVQGVWVSPAGVSVEIQFHTAASLRAKALSHPLFEAQRLLPPGDEWNRLQREIDAIWAPIRANPPTGVERVVMKR